MSAPSDNGGPAFPGYASGPAGSIARVREGMTLRDWFAGQALVGMNNNPRYNDASNLAIADWAYDQADAMLAARNVKEGAK